MDIDILLALQQFRSGIGGPVGLIVSCFVQMLYISFVYPLCLKCLEKPDPSLNL